MSGYFWIGFVGNLWLYGMVLGLVGIGRKFSFVLVSSLDFIWLRWCLSLFRGIIRLRMSFVRSGFFDVNRVWVLWLSLVMYFVFLYCVFCVCLEMVLIFVVVKLYSLFRWLFFVLSRELINLVVVLMVLFLFMLLMGFGYVRYC